MTVPPLLRTGSLNPWIVFTMTLSLLRWHTVAEVFEGRRLETHKSATLMSSRGCSRQQTHVDFPLRHRTTSATASVIIAFDSNSPTTLWVVRGSHREPHVRECSTEELTEVLVPAGHAIVFHHALFHAGAGYDHTNVRIHFFLWDQQDSEGSNKGTLDVLGIEVAFTNPAKPRR